MLNRRSDGLPFWLSWPTLIVVIWLGVQIVRNVTDTLSTLAARLPDITAQQATR
ncbi:MAG: hypothetical protein P4L66_00675 [Acetobacteraceae bacterium]|nr:hypothetical protein [Acetobacteraceae bacterium]